MPSPASDAIDTALLFKWEAVGKQMKTTLRVFDGERLIDTDTIDLAKTSKRSEFSNRIAKRTGFNVEEVESELLRIIDERSTANEPRTQKKIHEGIEDDLAEQTRRAIEGTDPELITKAESLLADRWIVQRIEMAFEGAGIAGEEDLALMLYLLSLIHISEPTRPY